MAAGTPTAMTSEEVQSELQDWFIQTRNYLKQCLEESLTHNKLMKSAIVLEISQRVELKVARAEVALTQAEARRLRTSHEEVEALRREAAAMKAQIVGQDGLMQTVGKLTEEVAHLKAQLQAQRALTSQCARTAKNKASKH